MELFTFNYQGEFIEYHGPEFLINKYGSAKPLSKYIGKFVKGKKRGQV